MPASLRRNSASARRGGVRAWLFAATLAACLASASPRSTQESLGFGAKSAAAIPSYAVSGEPAVLAVHGLNFAPGGAHPVRQAKSSPSPRSSRASPRRIFHTVRADVRFSLSLSLAHELTHALTHALAHALTPFPRSRWPSVATASAGSSCQRCSLPEGHALCRFDARGPHALTFPSGGAGDVARCAVDPARAGSGSPKGFAGVGLSDNAGSDWADVTFGEHAVVNFAEPSATSRALLGGGGPPAGLPVHLSGANFGGDRRAEADGGNRPPLACAFDGRVAPTALDENGGVSAALHRCETPPRAESTETRRTASVLPPGAVVVSAGDGIGGTLEGTSAVWTDTPWTRAGAVTVNKQSAKALSFVEDGASFLDSFLDRAEDERNPMEGLTLAAVEHLPSAVVFVMDLSGTSGKLSAPLLQRGAREQVRARYPDRPWLDVRSKADLPLAPEVSPDAIPAGTLEVSVLEDVGVDQLRLELAKLVGGERELEGAPPMKPVWDPEGNAPVWFPEEK